MNTNHPVVSQEAWLVQRRALLEREKALTHQRDQIARERRALPWVRIDKPYVFDTPAGRRTLAELFEGKRQLMVQHFMLGPGWEEGCKSCSFMADHLIGAQVHLEQRDLTVMLVSRAPLAEIERFRQRMGWNFRWASSGGSDFNTDFAVSFPPEVRIDGEVYYNYRMTGFPKDEAPGISFFYRDDAGQVFHTYSTYGRGVEAMMMSYDMLDMAPLGRGEDGDEYGMQWVRHHDRYASAPASATSCCASRV
jgi:predicted dithiol-disulfide oxidoreductase (DUF899 family)